MPARHLLTTDDLTLDAIHSIIERASQFLTPTGLGETSLDTLASKRFVLAFFEPSTRTRLSFESAVQRTGASCVHFTEAGSSVEKGESLQETIRTIESMGFDGIIMRHAENGTHAQIASHTSMSVINAGEGTQSHPTQALLDASTIHERFGSIGGRRVVIVGDLLHSRVARSTASLLSRLGAEVAWCAPSSLAPVDASTMTRRIDSVESAMKWADVVFVLRIQRERIISDVVPDVDEYRRLYSVTKELACSFPDVCIMHPGPVNVGVELDEAVLDMPQCLVHRQVTHGVAIRMSVLEHYCRSTTP
ncbi:MAG: aspartate carbamoyltransferase catalytic subunit [Candidatus Kapabacteria bacterium]|nr:aspartate carbamoyltransferase catalytic subunit [Candidatus Kapabacteria bacterium]